MEITGILQEIESAPLGQDFIGNAIQKYSNPGDIRNFHKAYVLFLESLNSKSGTIKDSDEEKYAYKILAERLLSAETKLRRNWERALPLLEHYIYCLKK